MFIHCQEPGDIWISRYLVPEQAGRGLLFYWMTRGGHISLPNSLHLIPLLAMGGRMQRMSKKKKLSEFREIDKERETEKSQAFQGHNAQDTGPCFLPFSYRICVSPPLPNMGSMSHFSGAILDEWLLKGTLGVPCASRHISCS
jgi:hypothetical protein